MADDLKRTLREVERAGWCVSKRGGGHWLIDGPNGERVVTCATRARGRAHANFIAELKRAGLDLRSTLGKRKRRRT